MKTQLSQIKANKKTTTTTTTTNPNNLRFFFFFKGKISQVKYGTALLISHSVMSYSLWPHGQQHMRLSGPSPSPWVCSNACPLKRWCHPTISSSVVPFSSCLPSFPASGSFPMSWLFASGGQSVGTSASASILPVDIQGWCLLGLTGLISLLSKGLSRVFSSTTIRKHQFFGAQAFTVQLSHLYIWSLGREDPLVEGMAIHSRILAWRMPWTDEPGGLQSIGSHRDRHNWSDLNTHACTGKTTALT